jgi:hypothetical protein
MYCTFQYIRIYIQYVLLLEYKQLQFKNIQYIHFAHAYIYINTYIHSLNLQIRCLTSDENSHSEELQQNWNVVFNKLRQESSALFSNRNYIVLFIAFSIGVGFFNSLLTLLNQIIAPHGYSNDDAGTFGAVFIGLGLVGAGIEYYLMYVCMYARMYVWVF